LSERFTDLAPPLTARQAAIESARCLYCYDAPCTRACPTGIDVASFIRNIHDHNIDGAATTILQQNIFGGSCARVCPTEILCEDACVRNHDAEGQPVKIGLLQRHAIDNAQFDGHPFKRAPVTGKTIAVVGAGPAGLSCAHRLAMLGHDVVVFEAREKSGGLNEYGIAKYKLPGDFAQREVEFLLSIGGIEIQHGRILGEQPAAGRPARALRRRVPRPRPGASRELGLTGEDAPGLMAAVDYIATLRQAGPGRAAGAAPRHRDRRRQYRDRHGGAAQAPRRDEVTLVYRRGFEAMSATGHEIEIAKTHFVRMRTWAAPLEVLLDDAGRVRGMRFEETRLQDGRLAGPAGLIEIAADAVFKAIGQGMGLAMRWSIRWQANRTQVTRSTSTRASAPSCRACTRAATAWRRGRT
jgi:dihydropyrimidine dehydrogenase (NAD+) subunit PreT